MMSLILWFGVSLSRRLAKSEQSDSILVVVIRSWVNQVSANDWYLTKSKHKSREQSLLFMNITTNLRNYHWWEWPGSTRDHRNCFESLLLRFRILRGTVWRNQGSENGQSGRRPDGPGKRTDLRGFFRRSEGRIHRGSWNLGNTPLESGLWSRSAELLQDRIALLSRNYYYLNVY